MDKVQRRDFIKLSAAGVVGNSVALADPPKKFSAYERVSLGKSGLRPTRLIFGTGVRSWNRSSELLRKGRDYAVNVIRGAYERGIRCFDMADTYGSHQPVADALEPFKRDTYLTMTKIWWRSGGPPDTKDPIEQLIERFLRELKTDYIDLVQLHCVDDGDWPVKLAERMEAQEKVKKAGKIRAHGISIHAFSALHASPEVSWLDAVHVRINPFGSKMEGPVDRNMAEITKLHQNGKGVIGMKILGEGTLSKDSDKINQSIAFALNSGVIDALDIGFVSVEEIDDIAKRIAAVQPAQKQDQEAK